MVACRVLMAVRRCRTRPGLAARADSLVLPTLLRMLCHAHAPAGSYILSWGRRGSGKGETFQDPRDLAGADDGSMIVLDK